MSYLGQKILYELANAREDVWAERVFAPTEEVAALLKEHQTPLASLEADTPLGDLDAIAFSITHELCYTNILYMLDLAGIPLRAEERDANHPLIIAGGGCTLNAEPVAAFCDIMVLGDGEETLMDLIEVIRRCKHEHGSRSRASVLREMASIPGVYVPSLFIDEGPGKPLRPVDPDLPLPEKRSVADINTINFPVRHILPFGKPVHDRLTVEIARGCTRGCRFCHAGMVYRPARERSLPELKRIIDEGLAATGYEEISFLSLSTGDFSAFQGLFMQTFAQCRSQQVSISLPSLRAGSLNESLLTRMAEIRHTGMTVAPEAGTQRLRDVINKGISEEEILELPTETREDLDGILDLCLKVRATAGKKAKRMQITAAISPFVPKPFTPFQWEPQISMQEIEDRLAYIKQIFKSYRFLNLKWHHSHMSFLEGIFSRGDRRLACVVEKAFRKGALFSSWSDHLNLDLWLEAMKECECDADAYIGGRDLDTPLPWDHLNAGVSTRFLRTERTRALGEKLSPDCRYNPCRNCGVCGFDGHPTILTQTGDAPLQPVLNNAHRDQHDEGPCEDLPNPDQDKLIHKACHYRLWYRKLGLATYLSQLELQRIFERALRRAELPASFSAGFHPMPLMSFGMALPVGVGSQAEWVNIYFRETLTEEDILTRLADQLPEGMRVLAAQSLGMGKKQPQAVAEEYTIRFQGSEEQRAASMQAWQDFIQGESFIIEKTNKRGRTVPVDLRSFVRSSECEEDRVRVVFDWGQGYTNPLVLLTSVCPDISPMDFSMVKERQIM